MLRRFFPWLLMIWSLGIASAAIGDSIALIRVGEQWKFIPTLDDLQSTATNDTIPPWIKSFDYDTTRWTTGISGFSTSSYQFTGVPMVGGTNGTVRFRKFFSVEEPEKVKLLTLRAEYQHGFVVWLNGVEVARVNVSQAAGLVPAFSQPLTNQYYRPVEEIDLSAKASLIKGGTNLLAIQYHAGLPASPSVWLVPELFANFTRAPVLLNMSSNQVLLHWKTSLTTTGLVEVVREDNLHVRIPTTAPGTNHYVLLTNLVGGTSYRYRVINGIGETQITSPFYSFRTLSPSNTPLRFTVFGDTGYGYLPQFLVAKQVEKLRGDFVIHLGDLIYPYLVDELLDLRIFSIYGSFNNSIPFMHAPGNHDSYNSGRDVYRNIFKPITRATDGIGLFRSFDHGSAHFVQLDADTDGRARYEPGSEQYQWLENDLATTQKPWKFIFFHHVMRSSSAHQYDDYNRDGISDLKALQQSIGFLASKYGVQVVMTSHDHNYERFSPMDGVISIVSGGGGASLYSMQTRTPGSSQFWSRYHCLDIQIEENKLVGRAVDMNGLVFDEFTIHRSPPVSREYSAVWATPEFPEQGANDSDGNIFGQRFTLTGEAVPTALGRFSGLGDAYFNNDARFLYVGFARTMLQNEQSIFVFLQNPDRTGVASLAGLGNGLVDPLDQGVDGLDFLENLGFTNFAPTIGCILGNEFADAQGRNFTRPVPLFQPGQGAFFLDANFSNVPGIKLQQFNRSPQLNTEREDENADFIQLAIPLASLGLHPGGLLRVGAVVGLAPVVSSLDQIIRELDTGYLGSGFGNVRLAPLSIRLATDPNMSDALALTITPVGEDGIEIFWLADPARTYTLQFTDSLAKPFLDHPNATGLVPTESRSMTFVESPGTVTRYYRLLMR